MPLVDCIRQVLSRCAYDGSFPLAFRGDQLFQHRHSCLIVQASAQVFNCSAPDTGNMELLLRFGSTQQQQQYLLPLLKGETRSCFAMTEPNTASSNPTQIQTTITGERLYCRFIYRVLVLPTHHSRLLIDSFSQIPTALCWSTAGSGGATQRPPSFSRVPSGDFPLQDLWRVRSALQLRPRVRSAPRRRGCPQEAFNCESMCVCMYVGGIQLCARTCTACDPCWLTRLQVIVPMNTAGVTVVRPLTVFGYDDAPHGHAEVHFQINQSHDV